MQVKIYGSKLNGNILASRSKSAMQRACALALIKQGKTNILFPGNSNDDLAAISIIENLGVTILSKDDKALVVQSQGINPKQSNIHCGESGLSIRMFTPIIATSEKLISIQGSGSLVTRPMDFFDEILPQLNVKVKSNEGKLPLHIQGPISAKSISVDGELSSQYITGLLMAYVAMQVQDARINVHNLKSKPYIDLTLGMMNAFGYNVHNDNYKSFSFNPTTYQSVSNEDVSIPIESDWSGVAFLLVAGSLAGDITIEGLDINSQQGDKAILTALEKAKVAFHINTQAQTISIQASTISPFTFDATDCPDLFPPLVALAAHAKGTSIIKGVSRLTHKESNRSLSLQEEFGKLGIAIELQNDMMYVHGGTTLKKANLFSHHDHRIAMALATTVLPSEHDYIIDKAEAIDKSYPDFYKHLTSLGCKCETIS